MLYEPSQYAWPAEDIRGNHRRVAGADPDEIGRSDDGHAMQSPDAAILCHRQSAHQIDRRLRRRYHLTARMQSSFAFLEMQPIGQQGCSPRQPQPPAEVVPTATSTKHTSGCISSPRSTV
jgi:hypothetical protein